MKTPVVEVERVCTAPSHLPPRTGPEVAVVGRSNVGKSTLVNALFGRADLLRTSRTPGRTQAVIFVRVGERGHVVDLPGYGFAKVPLAVRRSWAGLVNGYLESRRGQTALLLIDVRREPGEDERQLMAWFRRYEWTVRVVLTKSDKLPRGKRAQAAKAAAKSLGLETGMEPLLFSAVTGEGLKALRAIVERSMEPRT